ncbi:MAG: hypothetical protein A2Y33_00255 [Spirochaetes bacterium GWF1_51_8]|nr:MAG: hypothetical protein A2Y33_00255 [Spirochaetes bacterium GWF1_51_8]
MKILFIGSEFLGGAVKTYLLRDNKDRAIAFVKDYLNACSLMRVWQPDIVIHEWDEDDCSSVMIELASSCGIPTLAYVSKLPRDVQCRLNRIERSETLEKPIPQTVETPAFRQKLISSIRRLECIVKPKHRAA